jgi:hypothetical protein
VVEEPTIGCVPPSWRDHPQRIPGYFARDPSEPVAICADGKPDAGEARVPTSAPKNLVRHPIPDPWKLRLIEQEGFQWAGPVARQKSSQPLRREPWGKNVRGHGLPPLRRFIAQIKANPAKHPRIAKDQTAFLLSQHQVIVAVRGEVSGRHPQFSSHTKMDAQPTGPGTLERQLFATSMGGVEATAVDPAEPFQVGASKHPGFTVNLHAANPVIEAGEPDAAVKLHFRQLGHD